MKKPSVGTQLRATRRELSRKCDELLGTTLTLECYKRDHERHVEALLAIAEGRHSGYQAQLAARRALEGS